MSTSQLLTPPAHSSPLRGRVRRAAASPWAPLPVVLSGTFMVVLDFFIVNVALPSLQSDLHASNGAVEWVAAGYGLTAAVFLISAARLGDRIGRRRTFSLGLALFTASSAACGIAPSAGVLVASRLIQGLAGALLMPNILAIIGVAYDGPKRVRALTAYGLVMGLAAVGGQLVGGLLVQVDIFGLGWRSCFLINVPIGIVALALTPRVVRESRAPGASHLDVAGTSLITAALTAIVLPLIEGRQYGWPLWTLLSLALAPLLFAGFWWQQRRLGRRGGAPMLHPELFRHRAFSAGLATQLGFWCGQASFFLVLALYLQRGRGLSALHAGLVFTVLAVSYLVASTVAPPLAQRHGRRVLGIGALVLATGHTVLLGTVAAIGVGGSVVALVPGLLVVGAGMGMVIAPLATVIMSSVAAEHAGAASGALATVQNVGNSLGVAIVGVIFFGALPGGFAHAFELSLMALAVTLLGVAALTRLLPRPVGGGS